MADASAEGVSFVSASAIAELLHWGVVIDRLAKAYATPHGPATSPPRSVARDGRIWLRALTAVPPGARFMGAKVFGVGRKPAVNYLISLIEQASGEVRALVDGANITTFRTASTSAAAMQVLAPQEPSVLGVIGSGQEAQAHVRALHTIRPVRELRVFSPSADKRAAFAATFETETGVPSVPVDSAEAAARPATLVVAAARSRDETPTVHGDWLDNCRAIISVGSTLPEQREIDASVVRRADLIVCDVLEEVLHDTGDMIAARAADVPFEDKSFSLNDLLCGVIADRVVSARLPLFKSVGAGIQDVVVAELAYDLALEAGRLIDLPINFYRKA